MKTHLVLTAWLLVGSLVGGWQPVPTQAQQFRMETTVYAEDRSRPVSDNLTLFAGNKVYDFLLVANEPTKVTEIAIYDANNQQFTLLDTTRHLRLDLRQADLEQMLKNLTSSESFQEELRFLVKPEFTQQFEAASGLLELRSEHIQYTVRGQVSSNDAELKAYFGFIDAYTLLNATDPRKLPPFARIRLNQMLREHRLIPTDVEMTLEIPAASGAGATRMQAYSTHQITPSLTAADRERLAQVDRFVQEYSATTLGIFRRLQSGQTAQRN